MTIRNGLKTGMKRILASFGLIVSRARVNHERLTMQGGLNAIADRGHKINTVIDVGASNGAWSALMMGPYPSSRYLLIEALPFHEKALKQFCKDRSNAEYMIAAAGDKQGEIYFDSGDPFGGQASYTPFKKNNIVIPMTTIDDEVRSRKLEGPFLIKLDTHGFEVPILEGAIETLKDTESIVIECYNFRISPEGTLFHEMCAYLKDKGFWCIDLVDPLHRPYDDAFWQMDLIFARDDRPEFRYFKYK